MKLSKVKKICVDEEEIIVTRAGGAGIDTNYWIGVMSAMYPVHGMAITTGIAANIWDLDERKLNKMRLVNSWDGDECVLITAADREGMNAMAEGEDGDGNLRRICTIDNWILLLDERDGGGWILKKDFLKPVDDGRLNFFHEEGSNIIAAYSNGKLEAVFHCARWSVLESFAEKFDTIRKMVEIEESRKVGKMEGKA